MRYSRFCIVKFKMMDCITVSDALISSNFLFRSSHPEVFLGKGDLKICSKSTREHPCQSAILIQLQSNIIETTLRHGCSPVNLLHVFRTLFQKNRSGWLLLLFVEILWKYTVSANHPKLCGNYASLQNFHQVKLLCIS